MADVHVHQDRTGGSAAWVWAVVVLLLVGVIAWFVLGSANRGTGADGGVNVEVNAPTAPTGGGEGGGGN